MKSSIKTIALIAALSTPCLVFAELIGASLPVALDAETLIALFCIVLFGLISVADYSRRARLVTVRARPGRSAACEVNRLAA